MKKLLIAVITVCIAVCAFACVACEKNETSESSDNKIVAEVSAPSESAENSAENITENSAESALKATSDESADDSSAEATSGSVETGSDTEPVTVGPTADLPEIVYSVKENMKISELAQLLGDPIPTNPYMSSHKTVEAWELDDGWYLVVKFDVLPIEQILLDNSQTFDENGIRVLTTEELTFIAQALSSRRAISAQLSKTGEETVVLFDKDAKQ